VDNQVTHPGVDTEHHGARRRALLGAGLGGAALSLLPFLSGRAAAASDSTVATTTTAPPLRPTDADVEMLAALQRLELTAAELYSDAIAAVKWDDAQAIAVTTIRQAHVAFANSIGGLLGKVAPDAISESLHSQLKAGFNSSNADTVLNAAYDLESGAVAAYAEAISSLKGVNGAALAASIQISEARHCTVLADMSGSTDLAQLLVDHEQTALQGNA
jgi:hypothetical protein